MEVCGGHDGRESLLGLMKIGREPVGEHEGWEGSCGSGMRVRRESVVGHEGMEGLTVEPSTVNSVSLWQYFSVTNIHGLYKVNMQLL